MKAKTTRYLDDQGRVVIPGHIRKALNLNAGNCVEVEIDDGTIRITPVNERCEICGEDLKNTEATEIAKGKHICYGCAKQIIKIMTRR